RTTQISFAGQLVLGSGNGPILGPPIGRTFLFPLRLFEKRCDARRLLRFSVIDGTEKGQVANGRMQHEEPPWQPVALSCQHQGPRGFYAGSNGKNPRKRISFLCLLSDITPGIFTCPHRDAARGARSKLMQRQVVLIKGRSRLTPEASVPARWSARPAH